jgi:tetratricopeptide (TPR) repeat protein
VSDAHLPSTSDALRRRYAAIDARLESRLRGGAATVDRETLKTDIVALFRAVEEELEELKALKDDIRQLVDKWKSQADDPDAPKPGQPSVRVDHLNASTFIEKGWNLISVGDHAGAETALRRALELAPADTQAEALLGWAEMLQEKYDDALVHLQRVLVREPSNSLARVNVGYVCLKKGIFGKAIEHLAGAIRLDNDRKATLYAHFYLGLAYQARDMHEDAITFFRKALALGPNLLEAYYEMGRSMWKAGDREQALQTWREGARANKFNAWGKRCDEVRQVVEQGGAPPGL